MSTLFTKVEFLNEKNFCGWSFLLKLVLKEKKVWKVVSGEEARPAAADALAAWTEKDNTAMAQIACTVSAEIRPNIQTKSLAKAMWDTLKTLYD